MHKKPCEVCEEYVDEESEGCGNPDCPLGEAPRDDGDPVVLVFDDN